MTLQFRPLTAADIAIVWQMLVHAAHEDSLQSVQSQPNLARYAEDWGRPGDMGYVALRPQPIGAAWLRIWQGPDQGFGYVDETVPELAIAVLPEHRDQGIGTQLLQQLLSAAQPIFPAVSLSVRADNPAWALYQRLGFTPIAGSEQQNRTGGQSVTMVCPLSSAPLGQTLGT